MDVGAKDSGTCLELALEGERLCKCGDFAGGITYFEAAIKVGTSDMRTLSAIYSQLGNAYFYLNNYEKALNYHEMDLSIAKSMRDRVGEGKASGNLGNTLKMLGRFDEAVQACLTHLNISRELRDEVGEGRALYNLGNVFHTKGKQMARIGMRDPGDFPAEVRECLLKGAEYYQENLNLMTKMGDKSAQGRALGNLGNTHYLLGNFREAVIFHTQRLKIAQDFGDKAAERRAQCNLGNARVFLGDFDSAVKNYMETLRLAQELNDQIMEAQACYSLGNCFTLMRDFERAVEYHSRHLVIASQLADRVGEARAFWSISNAFASLGRHQEALNYATKHLEASKQLNDATGQEAAQQSVAELTKLIEEGQDGQQRGQSTSEGAVGGGPLTPKLSKRFSMDNMQLLKLTPGLTPTNDEASSSNFHLNLLSLEEAGKTGKKETTKENIPKPASEVNFLDQLAQFQCKRMDDQRCSFDPRFDKENHPNLPTKSSSSSMASQGSKASNTSKQTSSTTGSRTGLLSRSTSSPVYGMAGSELSRNQNRQGSNERQNSNSSRDSGRDNLFDLIEGIQGRRMEEQRAELPPVRRHNTTNGPGSLSLASGRNPSSRESNLNPQAPSSSSRLPMTANSNRASLDHPPVSSRRQVSSTSRQMSLDTSAVAPDDDFFEMLMRCQGSRLEDQRSTLPVTAEEDETDLHASSASTSHLKRSSQVVMSGGNTPPSGVKGATVPDEDFFSLILRVQSGRIDDQRTQLPSGKSSGSSLTSSSLNTSGPASVSHPHSAKKTSGSKKSSFSRKK